MFTVGPPAVTAVSYTPKAGGTLDQGLCGGEEGGPQLREHHGGRDQKKTGRFIWSLKRLGGTATFWLTKTMPMEKRASKDNCQGDLFSFFFLREERGSFGSMSGK